MATKANLKAALDGLGVSYRARASKEELQILWTDAVQASAAAEEDMGPASESERPPLKVPGEITNIFFTDDGEKHIAVISRKVYEQPDSVEEAHAESYRDILSTLEAYMLQERRRVGG